MIGVISKKTADWIIKATGGTSESKENYEYAVYSLLITLIPFSVLFIMSIIFNMLSESVFFSISYLSLRKFSGGYHLKKAMVCLIVSSAILCLFLFGIDYILLSGEYPVIITITLLSVIILNIFSPIDSKERKLSEREKVVYKKVVRYVSLVLTLVFMVLIITKIYSVAIPIGCGIILAMTLQIPVIIKRYVLKRE